MENRTEQRTHRPPRVSTRIKNSTKPKFVVAEPAFYLCDECHRLLVEENPFDSDLDIRCCGQSMQKLTARDEMDADAAAHRVDMVISGGFDANVMTVTVGEPAHPMQAEHHLEWIYLYTFQGGQIKFISTENVAGTTFALSDKDAYVYCDRLVCKGNRCKFNCKRGFTAYAYCNEHGLWKTTM